MATPYNHKAIEKKWRENWEKNPVNVKEDENGKRTASGTIQRYIQCVRQA